MGLCPSRHSAEEDNVIPNKPAPAASAPGHSNVTPTDQAPDNHATNDLTPNSPVPDSPTSIESAQATPNDAGMLTSPYISLTFWMCPGVSESEAALAGTGPMVKVDWEPSERSRHCILEAPYNLLKLACDDLLKEFDVKHGVELPEGQPRPSIDMNRLEVDLQAVDLVFQRLRDVTEPPKIHFNANIRIYSVLSGFKIRGPIFDAWTKFMELSLTYGPIDELADIRKIDKLFGSDARLMKRMYENLAYRKEYRPDLADTNPFGYYSKLWYDRDEDFEKFLRSNYDNHGKHMRDAEDKLFYVRLATTDALKRQYFTTQEEKDALVAELKEKEDEYRKWLSEMELGIEQHDRFMKKMTQDARWAFDVGRLAHRPTMTHWR
ncbi:hypothetical protein SLS56_003790 [Neofusicoccum ribis]|uniref:J domain-containing protein n=1 Tax=Neofusicoccum ribis TaxID=45134 RepID=A0ABR3SYG9_9PEZI